MDLPLYAACLAQTSLRSLVKSNPVRYKVTQGLLVSLLRVSHHQNCVIVQAALELHTV
ncbi:hypothetical protein DPMN_071994 [Dreissena polymorpha]|uniref:Uncharacterized protein n=1 Tax=Dreissena polymorpha TaxID=45954 RepID=A0A9D3Z7Z9_DREPO|nr:hypothetical protein DPMN_071994 [Dreissena polymorpha]